MTDNATARRTRVKPNLPPKGRNDARVDQVANAILRDEHARGEHRRGRHHYCSVCRGEEDGVDVAPTSAGDAGVGTPRAQRETRKRVRRRDLEEFLDQMRAQPGTWIEVREMGMTSSVSGMRVGLSGRGALNPGPPMVANFSDGRITLGESEFQASFSYRDGTRPTINADLSGKMLDVDAVLERLPESPATAPEAPGGSGQEAPAEPSPLLLLRDMDLTASLALDGMRISGLELTDVRTRLEARNGVVTIDPLAGALAGGRVDAIATIDLNAEPARVNIAPVFDLESLGAALAPWGLDRFVTGRGVLDMDLEARGLDPQAILGSLNGTGRYNFSDGSIQGLNLDGMVEALASRNVTQAVTAGVGGSTAFQTLAGELRVEDGTMRLPGMNIVTELLGVTGDVQLGLADLSLDGQLELQSDRLGRVPMALDGTLTSPKLMPDVGEALKQEAGRRLFDAIRKRTSGDDEDDSDGNGG